MFENPRTARQARNFTTNVSKILDLKWFFRKLILGALGTWKAKWFLRFPGAFQFLVAENDVPC